jgi:ABC-type branched-subunit amino acid transport system permease subunit
MNNQMSLTAYDIALIGGGFTILGALIGAFVTYFLALKLAQRNAKRDAGRRLREAFAPGVIKSGQGQT